ncbi:PQQ-binding-like beta-propeller repeat protein [Polyangium sp. y55x31]|uniref:outer membrane protein assembly factor BamB family protein n=1 Tax=Polyangium sp. y55x31 TaxID=3042688 RepID=UPI0024823C46|nr:PQQ-binding-like beta-propeller repeat protein [Polyangium sp. y55x31]MDI1480756.1 PQQ-binding-like beta-propeller repeat protein [Polyangium sp. y55x31]
MWKAPVENSCTGKEPASAVVDGKLVVPCWEAIHAFDPETGEAVWTTKIKYKLGGAGQVTPTMVGGLITARYKSLLVAIEPSKGELRWIYDSKGEYNVSHANPVEVDGKILVGARHGGQSSEEASVVLTLTPTPSVPY